MDSTPLGNSPAGHGILVLGGSGSGKSQWAEHLASTWSSTCQQPVLYLATGDAMLADADWQQRLQRHRRRRPANWQTRECGAALPEALAAAETAPLRLVDALSSWVSTLLELEEAAWQARVERLLTCIPPKQGPTILVSDEVSWGVVPASASGYHFRERLARLNRHVAQRCQNHWLVVAGRAVDLTRWSQPVPYQQRCSG
ncbi:MAG: bifunctional adenosylcobinamide kinase/adenosylcobinamide-phosphate guanylyltransferase [Synechococcus sp. SB0673_bin_10]|nr:bifunctional adenosylcobinamide kinase/adenosylcobinamide-phosphate guanylyltransferase [Synechococcus sp. SB0665_bin_28]MYF19762.1 bifunctional adenosylcobinamide kinase/adenosylcobinamide-phosphate guanylyltransferase [Synechococcus sp. SB0677_bin_5]MYI72450.1 bifunctional adenosylcobinamide kinase/adenosylcobinamide-phosphate guanylyltransferase [Synechococcus sp. SB0673_bin_10]